jgi:hypothetical protein
MYVCMYRVPKVHFSQPILFPWTKFHTQFILLYVFKVRSYQCTTFHTQFILLYVFKVLSYPCTKFHTQFILLYVFKVLSYPCTKFHTGHNTNWHLVTCFQWESTYKNIFELWRLEFNVDPTARGCRISAVFICKALKSMVVVWSCNIADKRWVGPEPDFRTQKYAKKLC